MALIFGVYKASDEPDLNESVAMDHNHTDIIFINEFVFGSTFLHPTVTVVG